MPRFESLLRNPYASEIDYFKNNQHVAGMMTEDDRIILNPYSKLSGIEQKSVINNEGYRLLMKKMNIIPEINISPNQYDLFKNTPYEKDEGALKQSILARILSGDPSAQATEEQIEYANIFKNKLLSPDNFKDFEKSRNFQLYGK
jgi:hypothetical protein